MSKLGEITMGLVSDTIHQFGRDDAASVLAKKTMEANADIKALFLELIAEVYNDPFDELSRVDLDNLRTKVDSL